MDFDFTEVAINVMPQKPEKDEPSSPNDWFEDFSSSGQFILELIPKLPFADFYK
jgi:hypothetical protein